MFRSINEKRRRYLYFSLRRNYNPLCKYRSSTYDKYIHLLGLRSFKSKRKFMDRKR